MEGTEKNVPQHCVCPVIKVPSHEVECFVFRCDPCCVIGTPHPDLASAQADCYSHWETMQHEGIILHYSPSHRDP